MRHIQLAVCAALLACAPAAQRRGETAVGDQYLILAADLEATNQPNLYDAVRQVRPSWFTRKVPGRSGDDAIAVYVEDHLLGPLGSLRRLTVFGTDKVRYLGPTEAQIRFGQQNNGRAAIVVERTRER